MKQQDESTALRQSKALDLLETYRSERKGGLHVDSVAYMLHCSPHDAGLALRALEKSGKAEQYETRGARLWRAK